MKIPQLKNMFLMKNIQESHLISLSNLKQIKAL
jgi:hypothetical protein